MVLELQANFPPIVFLNLFLITPLKRFKYGFKGKEPTWKAITDVKVLKISAFSL